MYESPDNSNLMSKTGVVEKFKRDLDNGLIVNPGQYVAEKKTSMVRPRCYPQIDCYCPLWKELKLQKTVVDYFGTSIVSDTDSDVSMVYADTHEGPPVGRCEFPNCRLDDVAMRECSVCGTDGFHHHLCAISAGQEEQSTLCLPCLDVVGGDEDDEAPNLTQVDEPATQIYDLSSLGQE
jgi:hypothetical protein